MTILQASDKVALIYKDERVTYRDLLRKVTQFSQASIDQHGERCVIISENRLEWVYAFYGCWAAKAIPVPVDAASTIEEIAYILKTAVRPRSFAQKRISRSLKVL